MSSSSIPIVRAPPEITPDVLGAFEKELAAYLATPGPGLVLDLDGVAFIGSAGLSVLVKVGMRLDGQDRRLAMARAGRTVERTIRLLGLERKMPLYRSLAEAERYVEGAQ